MDKIGKLLFLTVLATSQAGVSRSIFTEPHPDCPATGHHLLPHEYDCKKFYYCEYGEKWIAPRDCAPGTEFSAELQVCVHPAQANCNLPGYPQPDPTTTEKPETTTTELPPSSPVTVTSVPIITPTTKVPTTTEAPITTKPSTLEPEVTEPTTSAPETDATVTSVPILTPTTTEEPEVTPEPTTSAPVTNATVTSAPIITSTTALPTNATEEPEVTPEPTTSAPVTNATVTSAPIITSTTALPTNATEEPEVTPEPTTSAPVTNATVTSAPIITSTTELPTNATEEPEVTPEPTTSAPVTNATVTSAPIITSTTELPTNATEEPEVTPEPTTAAPVTNATVTSAPIITSTTELPTNATEEPEVTPEPTTSAPVTNATVTSAPIITSTTELPTNATEEPEVTSKPTTSAPVTNATTPLPPTTPEDLLPNGCPVDPDVHKLLPHETDCDKYYYCVFGKTVLRECPRGTYFNNAIQVCDWPENVNCTNSGNGTESTPVPAPDSSEESNPDNEGVLPNGCPSDFDVHQLLPHEKECSKFYYCVRGEKVERECRDGLHFNAAAQVCDWPSSAGCKSSGDSGEDSLEGSGDEPDVVDLLPNGCPVDSNIHQLLPHESDCGKFYQCVHGDKVKRECISGLHFNPVIQTCDWPENAGCTNSGNVSESEESSESSEASNESSGNGPDSGSELPNGCPADFNVHQLLPHESDCNKFYYCVNGEKVKRECNAGLHFNPAVQACDWPSNAGCVNSGNPSSNESGEDSGNSSETQENSGENSNESSGNGPDSGAVLPNGCPADPNVHQLLPHESECNKFYYCVHGDKVERECNPGLHFNPEIQVCDWPSNAGCANSGGNSAESGENQGSGSGGDSQESSGNGEDSSEGSGNGPDSGAVLPNGCPADPNVHQLLPHESECNKFYYCVNGDKVERECNPGLHFNPAIQVCDWPSSAGCANSGGNSAESGENQGSGSGGDSQESSGNGEDSSEGSGNGPDSGAVLPNGCPADPNVHQLLPHESECNKFYYCVNGDKVERECSPGLHFNAAIQSCDWPEAAGCTSSNGNGTDTEDGGSDGPIVEPERPDDSKCTKCNVLPWAHEKNCDKYWICNGTKAALITCSEGLHFNAKTLTCDLICNAGCVRESVQSTFVNDGLKIFLPWNKYDKELQQILKKKL